MKLLVAEDKSFSLNMFVDLEVIFQFRSLKFWFSIFDLNLLLNISKPIDRVLSLFYSLSVVTTLYVSYIYDNC